MNCNGLNLHSEYFWLSVSSIGAGFALAVIVRAVLNRLRRRVRNRRSSDSWKSPIVHVALSLTLAFVAVLGSLLFMNLSRVAWSLSHLSFYLTLTGISFIVRLYWRYLFAPLVLMLLGYVFLVTSLCGEWVPVIADQALMEIKILARTEASVSLELSAETGKGSPVHGFYTVEGKGVSYLIRSIEFPPWSFYPGVRTFFKPEAVYPIIGEPSEDQASEEGPLVGLRPDSSPSEPGKPEIPVFLPLSGVLRAAEGLGVITLREEVIVQSEVMALKKYGLYYRQPSGLFFVSSLE